MLNFGVRKQDFHIEITFDEDSGDNAVKVEMILEGEPFTATGTIVFDE